MRRVVHRRSQGGDLGVADARDRQGQRGWNVQPGGGSMGLGSSPWRRVLVLVVPLTAVVSSVRHPWVGIHDWVLMEQGVRRVGTVDTPLVGAPSRFGWHHLGPWPYYVMAPFFRLVPADVGLLFGAAMSNLLAAVGFVTVAVRQPRAPALVALAGLAVLLRGLGVGLLVDPWNPHLAIVPLALYLLLCVEIARGEPRRWRWASGRTRCRRTSACWYRWCWSGPRPGCWAAPVPWVPSAANVTRSVRMPAPARRRAGGWGSWRVPTVIGTVAWLPPVVDQVAGAGPLWRLARWTAGAELLEPGPWERGRLAAGGAAPPGGRAPAAVPATFTPLPRTGPRVGRGRRISRATTW